MSSEKFEKGMKIRREVLGDEYVDKAVQATTEFTKPLQEAVTEGCWGTIWTREALPKKTRSLITIAMLTAMKCSNELKLHVHGALRNGCSKEEIQEVLLQAVFYCGAPAGIDAFKSVKEVIEAWEDSPDD
ncbi:MAG: carboxymuconolactone decarboxylase family protein [Desulfobacterales bacterium]|nr:carboxymuconolactone decarboxylase family protein [Desulfobacterales bacterium]